MSKDNKNKTEETETLDDQQQNNESQAEENGQEETSTPEENESSNTEENEEQDPLVKMQQERDELKDKHLRLMAEFDNFKRRSYKEKLDTLKTAAKDTIVELLPILDDFDRAKANAEDENSEEPFSEGVLMIYNRLHTTLKNMGLEVMNTNGEPFDPDFHAAMTEIPAPSEELKGKIVDTIEKGYTLKGKIIRHAKVVVGK